MNDTINVAIIGVGNCASSLVQGVEFYKDADEGQVIPGLMHPVLGGYHINQIKFTAAFDIDTNKVTKDLAEAIYVEPNNTYKFADVPLSGVEVSRGMTHDGLGKYLSDVITKAPGPTADIVQILKETNTHVVINYLPVGSEEATKWYVEQVLKAGCAFINCIPVFIAKEDYWTQRFVKRGLPIIGDDIKSQVGATILHRVLARLFQDRGVRIDRTYQLNFGGKHGLPQHARARAAGIEEDSRRREPSPPRSSTRCPTPTCTWARPTTSRGCKTGSGATSAWKAPPSATCH